MILCSHNAELIAHTDGSQKLIERCGRICYKSEGAIKEGSDAIFIDKIVKRLGHESIAEHASATFIVTTNLFTSHQIVRHRLASYSQASMRYCNFSKKKFQMDVKYIPPVDLPDEAVDIWTQSMEAATAAYFDMLEKGCKPEVARSVLPVSASTEIVITMNMRSWMHFVELRTSKHSQADIRLIAESIQTQLKGICPDMF